MTDDELSTSVKNIESALTRVADALEAGNKAMEDGNQALGRIINALENGNEKLETGNRELTEIKNSINTHTTPLYQIAQSNIGQWECALHTGEKSDVLLKVSLQNYDKTPPERYAVYAASTAQKEE